jgi:hypothetical protein
MEIHEHSPSMQETSTVPPWPPREGPISIRDPKGAL